MKQARAREKEDGGEGGVMEGEVEARATQPANARSTPSGEVGLETVGPGSLTGGCPNGSQSSPNISPSCGRS